MKNYVRTGHIVYIMSFEFYMPVDTAIWCNGMNNVFWNTHMDAHTHTRSLTESVRQGKVKSAAQGTFQRKIMSVQAT